MTGKHTKVVKSHPVENLGSINIVIPTFNPIRKTLNRVISRAIEVAPCDFDIGLIVVDNCSDPPITLDEIIGCGAPIKLIREPRPGTAFARITGLRAVDKAIVLYLDDDNLVTGNYISDGVEFLTRNPEVGAVGGKIIPLFEIDPPPFLNGNDPLLAIRDFGDEDHVTEFVSGETGYPYNTPLTAGLIFHKEVVQSFLAWVDLQREIIPGRIGKKSLGASEDCEFLMQGVYLRGMQSGYCGKMKLEHIIPKRRMEWANMRRTAFQGGVAWGGFELKYQFRSRQSHLLAILRSIKQFVWMAGWSGAGFLKWLHFTGQQLAYARKE